MKTTNSIGFVLALALGATAAGCATESSTMPGGDDGAGDGDSGDGSGGGKDQKPLDAAGTYAMHSTFDLATNMPGTAGDVVNTIIDATDDSDDPTHWILDQIISQITNDAIRSGLQEAEPFVAGFLNDKLLDAAPAFVRTMVAVGHNFGAIARNFGLNETFVLTGSGGSYTAVHTITGAHFKLGTQESDFLLSTYHVPNVVVNDVAVTMDPTGQLTIASHDIPLAYGKLLKLGLDAAIIPALDPSAHSLNELFAHKLDCDLIGTAVYDGIAGYTGFHIGSAQLFIDACKRGRDAAASFVYAKIDSIDLGAALQFGINGTARAMDRDNDRTIDAIVTGTWDGTLSYGSTPTPLVPATFFGERM
ncbi:MAG TPA: hypothetical protein VFT22_31635 [Kofleriaceae bacterium]|nr:hypothetical protein [Kofleriaceae bacterium]